MRIKLKKIENGHCSCDLLLEEFTLRTASGGENKPKVRSLMSVSKLSVRELVPGTDRYNDPAKNAMAEWMSSSEGIVEGISANAIYDRVNVHHSSTRAPGFMGDDSGLVFTARMISAVGNDLPEREVVRDLIILSVPMHLLPPPP